MTTTSIEHLENRIEQLVREHIVACREGAEAAIKRAFASADASRRPARPRGAPARSSTSRRRGPDEMAALSERLYEAVCASPGAAMAVLAARVGATPRELNRPALILKRAGRVRSVGQRHATRYFPMAAKTSNNA